MRLKEALLGAVAGAIALAILAAPAQADHIAGLADLSGKVSFRTQGQLRRRLTCTGGS